MANKLNFSVIAANAVKVRIPKDVLLAICLSGTDARTGDTWHDPSTTKGTRLHLVPCGQGWYNLSTWPHQSHDALISTLMQIEALSNGAPEAA